MVKTATNNKGRRCCSLSPCIGTLCAHKTVSSAPWMHCYIQVARTHLDTFQVSTETVSQTPERSSLWPMKITLGKPKHIVFLGHNFLEKVHAETTSVACTHTHTNQLLISKGNRYEWETCRGAPAHISNDCVRSQWNQTITTSILVAYISFGRIVSFVCQFHKGIYTCGSLPCNIPSIPHTHARTHWFTHCL